MMTLNTPDYTPLDVPEVLLRLFHPRPELSLTAPRPKPGTFSSRWMTTPWWGPAFIRLPRRPPPSSFSTATARSWLIMTNWPPSTGARASTFCRWITGVMAAPPAPRR